MTSAIQFAVRTTNHVNSNEIFTIRLAEYGEERALRFLCWYILHMQGMAFSTLMLSRSQASSQTLEQKEKQSYAFPLCSNISFIFWFLHTLTLQFNGNCLRNQKKNGQNQRYNKNRF